jgi:hypothetical protein
VLLTEEIAQCYSSVQKNALSPYDDFLGELYGILQGTSKIGFQNEDVSLLAELTRSMEAIGASTIVEVPQGVIYQTDDAASVAVWNIHAIGIETLQRNLLEGTSQTLESIKNIGVKSLDKIGEDSLACSKLHSLGKNIVHTRDTYLTRNSLSALNELLIHSVQEKMTVGTPPRILEAIGHVSVSAIDEGFDFEAFTPLFPIMPQNSLLRIIQQALKLKNGEYPLINTAAWEADTKRIVSDLLATIGKIASKAVERYLVLLVKYIVLCVEQIVILLAKEKFKAYKEEGFQDELLQTIGLLVNTVIVRKNHWMPKIVWDGSDAMTTLAFASIDYGLDEVAIKCEKAVLGKCLELIESDVSRDYAPEFVSRIAIMGAYAHCKGKTAFGKSCIADLVIFEREYIKRSVTTPAADALTSASEIHERIGQRNDWLWQETYSKLPAECIGDFDIIYANARKAESLGN